MADGFGGAEKNWSGRRDLNPRLRPWQGRTLPLSYSRSSHHFTILALFRATRECLRLGQLNFDFLGRPVQLCDAKAANLPGASWFWLGRPAGTAFPARLQH